mgnify:CR=1 FL=1
MPDNTITLELKSEVDDLLSAYAQCIDDDDLENWPNFFTEQCLYRIIPRENHEMGLPVAVIWCDSKGMLNDRVTALRHANVYQVQWYRHNLSNPRILSTMERRLKWN